MFYLYMSVKIRTFILTNKKNNNFFFMKIQSAKDFFYKYITVNSALMPEDYRLTYMEIQFLVECCMYSYEGNDLKDSRALTNHFMDINFFSRKTDVALYKYKIGLKKWAKTGRKAFELPGVLGSKRGDKLDFNLSMEWVDSE